MPKKKRCGRSQGGPRWGYDATLFGCLLAGAIKNKWILPVYMAVLCRGTTTPYRLAWCVCLTCVQPPGHGLDQPDVSQFPLSGWVNPPSSHFYICLFSPPLLHFDAPAIPPALQAPRVQLALQTPCSQHAMHNPAPVMPDYIETCIETKKKKKKEEWLALFSVVSFSLMTINAWSNSIRLFLLSIVCSLLFLVRHFFFARDHDFHGALVRDKWRDMTEGWPLENVMVSMKCLNCQCCLETFKFLSYCLAVAYNVMTRWII